MRAMDLENSQATFGGDQEACWSQVVLPTQEDALLFGVLESSPFGKFGTLQCHYPKVRIQKELTKRLMSFKSPFSAATFLGMGWGTKQVPTHQQMSGPSNLSGETPEHGFKKAAVLGAQF